MDPLGCWSDHGWETECRGRRAQFGWDVVVELDEKYEGTASREG